MTSAARTYARQHRSESLNRLVELLRIPSVSAVPAHRPDVQRAAEWVATAMRESGLTGVRVDATPGLPVVYGEWIHDEDAPTVLVYGHYDVQPPEPLELWDSPPFEPTQRDGGLYARGSSDDKGQFLAHLEAARAHRASGSPPPTNLKVFIEGEEEVGSPSLEAWLEKHAGDLTADVAVISDSAMAGPDRPSVVYGLRGLAYLEITVRGPNRDLHSGQFGGAVVNPIHVLADIVAALHDADGRITIPGFYDAVRPLEDDERAELARMPFDLDAYKKATGTAGGWGEPGYSVVERIGGRPSLDANGIWGGWTGDGAKTVIPAEAHAKISMRLVPDQEPAAVGRMFESYIRSLAPEGVSVTVRELHGGMPVVVDRSIPAMAAARAAYADAFGREPVFAREGGTIPVVASLRRILGIETVLMGFGLPDDNLHAPNEKMDLENYYRGIETSLAFLEELAGRDG